MSVNKCGGICNTIDDPYARDCAPNKIKIINAKVFKLISWINETKIFVQHQSRECKCRKNESVSKSMQKWNHWCECKELDIAAPVKMIICRILARVIVNAIEHIKLMNT